MEFDELWNQINASNASIIKKMFSQLATGLLTGLILRLINQDEIEIGIAYENREACSIVTYCRWESEKELSILLTRRGKYNLLFSFWDENGKLQEIKHSLKDEEIVMIPDGLKNLMNQALKNSQSLTVNRNAMN